MGGESISILGSRTFRLLATALDEPRFMFTGVLLGEKSARMKSNVSICFEEL